MTGLPLITPAEYPIDKRTHLIQGLSGDVQFRYICQCRFGRFRMLGKNEDDTMTGMEQLRLEPDDPRITADWLKEKLAKRKKSIKETLSGYPERIGNLCIAVSVCARLNQAGHVVKRHPAYLQWSIGPPSYAQKSSVFTVIQNEDNAASRDENLCQRRIGLSLISELKPSRDNIAVLPGYRFHLILIHSSRSQTFDASAEERSLRPE